MTTAERIALMAAICAVIFALFYYVPAHGHDIYEDLTKDTPCTCGMTSLQQLCEAVEAVPASKGGYYLPASGETIAWEPQSSPDDRFHRCTWPLNTYWQNGEWNILPNNSTLDGKPKTRCFWAPRITS